MWIPWRSKIDEINRTEELEEKHKNNIEKIELEKGDGLAIFIATIITFGPILLFFIVVFFIICYIGAR